MLKSTMIELNKGDWCFLENDTCIAIQYGEDNFRELVVIPVSVLPLIFV